MMLERFKEELKRIAIAKLVSDLIRLPSYSFMENQERANHIVYLWDFAERKDRDQARQVLDAFRPYRYSASL